MELHSLTPAKGSVKNRKRIARGEGSGHGGTSTRGHKGAKARSGYSRKRNHEGGQMPLQMRLPKKGFKSPNKVIFNTISLERLTAISEKYNVKEISPEVLHQLGLVKRRDVIKILGEGDIKSGLTVKAHAISDSAKEKLAAAGVSFVQL